MDDPMVGEKIGNYVVTGLLGEGGFGAVYLAEHPQIKREVAIKVLVQRITGKEAHRFIDEARAATSIKHPNIIDIFDLGQTDEGRLYYVMEKLEGQDLLRFLTRRQKRQGAMSPRELLPMVEQICAGLQAAHEQGVIHRDLKPENIFVVEGADPFLIKIVDFGIAKLMEREEQGTSQTRTGMVMGTPLFIAREQAAGDVHEICEQTDLYSLGVILYTALTGEPPFQNKSHRLLMFSHMYEEPPPLEEAAPGCLPGICALVMQCLEKTPGARPGSAAEVARLFAAALDDGDVQKEHEPSGPLSNIPLAAKAAPEPAAGHTVSADEQDDDNATEQEPISGTGPTCPSSDLSPPHAVITRDPDASATDRTFPSSELTAPDPPPGRKTGRETGAHLPELGG